MNVIAKLLNSSGYLAWMLQILWLVLLYVDQFFSSPLGKIIKPAHTTQITPHSTPPIAAHELPPISPWILIILAIGLVALTLYIIFANYIPAVNHTSEKVIEKAAVRVVNKVELSHKKNLSKKKHTELTHRIMVWIKILISCLPIVLVIVLAPRTKLLSRELALGGTALLSLAAVVPFVFHHVLLSLRRVKRHSTLEKKTVLLVKL